MITLNYILDSFFSSRRYLVKDLGVYFDPKLTFNQYVNNIKNKSLSTVWFIKIHCFKSNDSSVLKYLYTSFNRSQIEYVSIVLGELSTNIEFLGKKKFKIDIWGLFVIFVKYKEHHNKAMKIFLLFSIFNL